MALTTTTTTPFLLPFPASAKLWDLSTIIWYEALCSHSGGSRIKRVLLPLFCVLLQFVEKSLNFEQKLLLFCWNQIWILNNALTNSYHVFNVECSRSQHFCTIDTSNPEKYPSGLLGTNYRKVLGSILSSSFHKNPKNVQFCKNFKNMISFVLFVNFLFAKYERIVGIKNVLKIYLSTKMIKIHAICHLCLIYFTWSFQKIS